MIRFWCCGVDALRGGVFAFGGTELFHGTHSTSGSKGLEIIAAFGGILQYASEPMR